MTPRRLVLEFTKMSGAGNDFIVVDNRFYHFSDDELAALAARLCPRRTGVGADGLLALCRPADDDHDFRMRYLNADGSIGTMCGNGARCLARFARGAGIDKEEMTFGSDAGPVRAVVPAETSAPVRVYLASPRAFVRSCTLQDGGASGDLDVHTIWTGTEHAVCFVSDVDTASVLTMGRAVRRDAALAPAGANVNFVEVEGAGAARSLVVRTYEKGVEDETLACGTGAVASAVVARLMGRLDGDVVSVRMPGGTLRVGFRVDGQAIQDLYLEGPAETVFRGTVEV